jgi:hypothetical protein
VNILLGWSGIGWIWAFIWSLGSTGKTVVVVAPQQVASTPNSTGNKTVAERITDLKAMLDSGTITQSEFDALKADAMKGIA